VQNQGLLFWILNSDKKPLYVNAAGNVEVGASVFKSDGVTPAHLQFSPDGWNDTMVNWGRSNKYLGLFREFSVPLNFVKDGAKILRWAMWNYGIEAVLYLSILKLDRTTFPDKYEQWYTGELDFSQYKQTKNGVDITIMEGGLSKILKAQEGTSYEVRINDDTERRALYLDGMPFENRVECNIFDQEIAGAAFTPGSEFWVLGTGIISNEGTSQGVISADQAQSSDQPPNSPNSFFTSVSKTIPVNISGSISVKNFLSGTTSIKIFIHKHTSDGVFVSEHVIVPIQNISGAGTFITVSYSFTIPFEPGTKATLYARVEGASSLGGIVNIIGSMSYNYNVTFDSTLCECLTWMRVFEKLTEKMTKGKYGCRSNFLSSLDDTNLITSGQAIRQYKSDAVIKTNFNDFFKACQRWGVGLGIENDMLIIEKHEYFFQNDIAIELGEVNDVEWIFAEDLGFNTIKSGYTNQTYDNVNGIYEFNVTQQYTTPITRNVKELDLICPYRADMTGIELTRLKLFQLDTTDNKADNETFIVNVEKGTQYNYYKGTFEKQINTGSYFILIPTVLFQLPNGQIFTISGTNYTVINTSYLISGFTLIQVLEPVTAGTVTGEISIYDPLIYKLNRPVYSPLTGLLFPDEAFNIELSPKRSLLNNGAYIHSVLDFQDAGKVDFQSGEKNSNLVAGPISEKGDIVIYDLPDKLFLPYYAKFKTKVPLNLPAIMRMTPYSKIAWLQNGVRFTGYLWKGGIAPADNDSQSWQILSSPENNLNNLI